MQIEQPQRQCCDALLTSTGMRCRFLSMALERLETTLKDVKHTVQVRPCGHAA
jgi:hypothetical protein